MFIFRSDILSLLRTYNCYHEGKNFQLRTREVRKADRSRGKRQGSRKRTVGQVGSLTSGVQDRRMLVNVKQLTLITKLEAVTEKQRFNLKILRTQKPEAALILLWKQLLAQTCDSWFVFQHVKWLVNHKKPLFPSG